MCGVVGMLNKRVIACCERDSLQESRFLRHYFAIFSKYILPEIEFPEKNHSFVMKM